MSSKNLAEHYDRLIKVFMEYKIQHVLQVFKINEAGLSTRKYGRDRAKGFMKKSGRGNYLELDWSKNAEHVTLMFVVSADGKE